MAILRELRNASLTSRDMDSIIMQHVVERESVKLESAREYEDFHMRVPLAARFLKDACNGRYSTSKARNLECCSM